MSPSANADGPKDVDYILDTFVGGGHWWQWRTTLLLYPIMWAGCYPVYLHIFAAYEPAHRCHIPCCDSIDSQFNESHVQFSIPKEESLGHMFTEAKNLDPCKQFDNFDEKFAFSFENDQDNVTCTEELFNQNSTRYCESYVYSRDVFTNTLTMDLNLVCEEGEYKQNLLGTLMMLGLLVGSFIGGRLGDAFGRKPVMFGALVVLVPSVAAGGIYPNYIAYGILRLVSATMLPIMWVNTSAYCMEIFSPGYRLLSNCIRELPLKMYLFCLVLYLVRDWQHMHYCFAALCALGLPAYFFVPESPRWLIMHGRKKEALQVFEQIAKTNHRDLSDKEWKDMEVILESIDMKSQKDGALTPLDMFRGGLIFNTLIILLCWITVCLGYYGLTLNATKLAGDPILNFFLAFLPELPLGLFLYLTLDRFGRRWITVFTFTTLGICCIVLAFIPKSKTNVILGLYLLGKFTGAASFSIVWLYTNELYPTNLRAQAIGTCSMASRAFGLCAPFVGSLAKYWQPLPLLVLGLPAIISGCMAILLPETADKQLPQTMSQANRLFSGSHDAPKLTSCDSVCLHRQ